MIARKIFLLLFLVSCESKPSLVPQSIVQLIQKNNVKNSLKVEVFYNSEKLEILDETLKLLSELKEVKLTKLDEKFDFTDKSFSADGIFLFDTFKNYLEISSQLEKYFLHFTETDLRKRLKRGYWKEINFMVYCEDLTKRMLESSIFKIFQSFLVEENREISLNAMTMFTEKECRVPQIVEINRFSNQTRKWKTEKFSIGDIENFHGCQLKLELSKDTQLPFLSYKVQGNGVLIPEGVLIDMIEAFSASLNFTITYIEDPDKKFESNLLGYFNSNVDVDDSPERYEREICDWRLGMQIVDLKNFEYTYLSDPIYSTSDVFVVPPGQTYTAWEKLLMPFDQATWIWIIVFFAVAFLVIFLIILSKSTTIYDFVIGANVTSPSLNVVGIFMGIGQMSLPPRNSPRLFFMLFTIFCLIIRTAYQGKYFEFLTSDMKKKPMASVEQLIEMNSTVFLEFVRSYSSHRVLESRYGDLDIFTG